MPLRGLWIFRPSSRECVLIRTYPSAERRAVCLCDSDGDAATTATVVDALVKFNSVSNSIPSVFRLNKQKDDVYVTLDEVRHGDDGDGDDDIERYSVCWPRCV